MAPKGGRGGSSSGSKSSGGSSVSCPNAFLTTADQVYFSSRVLFTVVYFVILLFYVSLWKKNKGRKMLGWPVVLGILSIMLAYILLFVNQILQECDVLDYYDTYKWTIPINIFWYIADFLLLFVFVWTLNTSLRAQLGRVGKVFKAVVTAILVIMGLITIVEISLVCYVNGTQIEAFSGRLSKNLYYSFIKMDLAYVVLYLASVVASGALALTTIIALRKRSLPAGDLLGWTIVLTLFLIIYQIFQLPYSVAALRGEPYTVAVYAALSYVTAFFRALCYVSILYIGKHFAWSKTSPAITTEDPKHAYSECVQPPISQAYHSQHPPPTMYTNSGNTPVHGNLVSAPLK